MKSHLRRAWTPLCLLALTLWTGGAVVPEAPAQESLTPPPVAAETQPPAQEAPLPAQWPQLALAGRFDTVLAALRNHPEIASPQAQSLRQWLETQLAHEQARAQKNQQVYAESLEKLHKALAQDALEDAMLALIDAHSTAQDPAATLLLPEAQDAIRKADDAAQAAIKAHDWLAAASYSHLLDALFDKNQQYHPLVRKVDKQLRLFRLYAPEELKRLYIRRAKALNKEDLEPPSFGNDTWEQTLTGVEFKILEAALARTAAHHVAHGGYKPIIHGMIDGLLALVDTPQLAQTFPALGDAVKVQDFRAELEDARQKALAIPQFVAPDLRRLMETIADINANTIDLPDTVLAYEMGDGAIAQTDDFTSIIWPREVEEMNRTTTGRFFGVGILIGLRTDPVTKTQRITVFSPLDNSPAQKAGIKPGDIIATVEGKSTAGWTIDQAVRTITGPESTEVTLGIDRPAHKPLRLYVGERKNNAAGKSELRPDPATTPAPAPDAKPAADQPAPPKRLTFKLERQEIPIETVRGWVRDDPSSNAWNHLIDPVGRIGYVRITQFTPQTADDLDAAVESMEQTGPLRGLIVDLRYDPGGLLDAAVEVSNRFIAHGRIVATVTAAGIEKDKYQARPERAYAPFPVAVLINAGSASASEIVAGALQDHGRAIIVGERSFGKGSVQDVFPLAMGKAKLRLTTHYYMLPKGGIIHRLPGATQWGIQPDLEVKITPQEAIDALEYRQELEILQDKNEQTEPARENAEGPPPPPLSAQNYLAQGLDPQLEAALSVLKIEGLARTSIATAKH